MTHDVTQWFPQVPQLLGSFCRFTSQPSIALPLQFAKPGTQDVKVHTPPMHAGPVVFGRGVHTKPQLPQLFGSACVFTSQPSTKFPLQFANPGRQAPNPHTPPMHVGLVVFGRGVHTKPQLPQLFRSVCVLISQPSIVFPLQLTNGGMQGPIEQAPPMQTGVACGGTRQTLPQAPQLLTSV
jgi:hypothetical protein